MTVPTMLDAIVNALISAGASEEIIAAAVKASGEFGNFPRRPNGRPRKHVDDNARKLAWKRAATKPGDGDETRDETPVPDGRNLRVRLIDASNGNVDSLADISPIRAVLAQGCDLEADVVPIVARDIPDMPRPLKNWGAPWLVRDILAARDQRLAAERE